MAAYDINPLDEEEERKRREAIAQRMEDEAMSNPVGPVNPSFLDKVGTAIGNRFDGAMNRVSQAGDTLMNPGQAVYNRMMNDQREEQQDEAANTEVKTQTVKSFADGSQERVVKTQVPAQQAQQAQPQAQFGGMMGPVAPNSPEAQQQAQMFAEQMARSQQNRGLTTPIAGMPDNLPAQGKIPAEAANQRPVMAQLPQPGPRVQVAGATQMPPQAAAPGASLAQAGAQAQQQPTPQPAPQTAATQQAPWLQAANDAGSDRDKLFDVATRFPESRSMIMTKLEASIKNKNKEDEAMATLQAAQAGDLKAMNKIQQAIKPETGKAKQEVTVNDYLAAVLYKRLGLDAMAAEKQLKILGQDTKYAQITFGGSNWQVETTPNGQIIRAKDDQGNIATESTLNKLRAGGQKFGSQSTAFTGGIHTVPNAEGNGQDLVMPTQNSMTGQAGFTYASGPKQGQPYNGTATPQPQSIGTSFQKAVDKALVDFKTAPSTAAAKAALEKAALLDPGDNTLVNAVQQRINATSPEILRQATQPTQAVDPSAPAAPSAPSGNAAKVAEAQRNIESIQRELAKPKPAGFSQQSEDQRKRILRDELAKNQAIAGTSAAPAAGKSLAQQEADLKVATTKRESDISTAADITKAEEKEVAGAKGKGRAADITNQRSADEAYSLIQPVANLIKKSTGSGIGTGVDSLARLFGVGTPGAAAISELNTMSYQFKYMVPRFEGPQSDRDTALYVEAAGDFSNPKKTTAERLSALKGMIFMLKKYDKEGKNDWTYGGQDPTSTAKQDQPMTEQQKAQAELKRREKK